MSTSWVVRGMTCEGCARSVRRALEREGVAVERVEHAAGRVVAAGTPEAETIRRAVEAAGFEFGGAAPSA